MLLERRCRLAGVAPEQNLQLIGPGDRIACRMPFPAADAADAADALCFAHGRLGPLERRDVRDVGNEALDPAIDGVWKAVGQAVPCLSARAGQQALEGLDMPERGQTDEELVEREQRRAEQVLKGPPDQRSGVDAEPRLVGLVGEPAAQVAVRWPTIEDAWSRTQRLCCPWSLAQASLFRGLALATCGQPPDLPLRVRPPEGDEETWERPGVSS